MNTVENPSPDLTTDQPFGEETQDNIPPPKPEITGFDPGTRPLLREPSLYLSIAVAFVVSLVSLSKTPTVFWLSFISMAVLCVVFHVVAERVVFKSKKEFREFAAPFEGIFVVTFGAILPGLGLLSYSVYALSSAAPKSILEEMAKVALLLVVPVFNFAVWSAVRKGYLIRPRLIGLMNGLALGLSLSWTVIWIKTVLVHDGLSCKFGWMLLLCLSPFLLFAATCLGLDLWKKTQPNIRRITTAFSILGAVLSFLFIFTPMVRAFSLQSLVHDAKYGSPSEQSRAIFMLRTTATPEDLRPSKHPVNGFMLSELLIPDRGLDNGYAEDRKAYFKITGAPYSAETETQEQSQYSSDVGSKIPGLALSQSRLSGNINPSTLSGAVDWTLTFHNSTTETQEACGEMELPKGAVVSRATLWINGEPREAAFATTEKVRDAYVSTTSRKRDPLLVTMSEPGKVLIQCSPVPAKGGNMKIRLGIKIPLETTDGKTCSMQLPKLLATNFAVPKRHRISLVSQDKPLSGMENMAVTKAKDGYLLDGIMKTSQIKPIAPLVLERNAQFTDFATSDWYSHDQRSVLSQLREVPIVSPKRLYVVIDGSGALKDQASQIVEALSVIPSSLKPTVYFVAEDSSSDSSTQASISPITPDQAKKAITADKFVGGQDNEATLQEVLETAAEQSSSAVLWIHGPQPTSRDLPSNTILDLVHKVRLFDMQVHSGPVSTLQALHTADASKMLSTVTVANSSVVQGVKELVAGWEKGTKQFLVRRSLSSKKPDAPSVADRALSAQVTCLWANEEVTRLLANGMEQQARALAAKYRLVTPVTGAVVLDTANSYAEWQLDPGAYKATPASTTYSGGGGLVGAPVDPRFGQSNEVGMLADYGYDTARDVSRVVTALSVIVALFVAIFFLRSRKEITGGAIAKAIGLVFLVPTIVHVLGTFMINNFGGLGGGL
jgi:hypothetical protein